jgi:tripartite-type tricarboxylate transporter receptor subunit TctC
MNISIRSALAWACALWVGAVAAQTSYPTKPVRLIVPFGAGGTTDALARLVAHELQVELEQAVVVENMAGGSGIIGTAAVARAAPDGYTLAFTTNVHTINPALRNNLPFDPLKSFAPVMLVASSPNMLVVASSASTKTLQQYLAAAKAKPGQISYSSSGIGTSTHIAAEQLSAATGTQFIHAPYNVSSQVIQSVLAGTVASSWTSAPSAMPFIKNGRLVPLAMATDTRSPFAPDVPTFAELGIPGMRSESWFGILAPAGTPAPVLQRLSLALDKRVNRSEVKERMLGLGAVFVGTDAARFSERIRDEIQLYTQLARSSGIKIDQ